MDIKLIEVEKIISKQRREIDCANALARMGIDADYSNVVRDREIISYILSEWLRNNNGDAREIKL